jgi:hypothetical protein
MGLSLVDLIPLPLLPGEKGSYMHIINGLAPLPWLIFIHILLRIILSIICSDLGDPSFFHR